jgi:hypothetical protein
MKESETESEDLEADKEIVIKGNGNGVQSCIEQRAGFSKSNLQILLSQNDILPFLRWLKQEKTNLSFEEYIQRIEKNKKVILFNLPEITKSLAKCTLLQYRK